ncbi:hypothetical protein F1640_03300 [Novosphingobium sp. NBM11]|uniref:hypothetical protein n=1 Tax=Novosphingobium sp. NBM11 TaxID=2596914 RepID=UPI001891F73A|nr:hypothetical protein [Novosphingobium sp. NBM11]MBF5089075.1 hypothetical protein [Novosphingobium sp. NBM11]
MLRLLFQIAGRRGAPLLLVVFAAFGFASPAKALTDSCQSLSDRLHTADWAWLKSDLKDRLPTNDEKVFAPITIFASKDVNLLGPRYVEAWKGILIPPRYFQAQCNMVLLQLLYQADPDHDYGQIALRTRDCVARHRPKPECFDTAITDFITSLQPKVSPKALDDGAADLFSMTIFAIRFQLAHEAGHILTAANHSATEFRLIDTEAEADILAEISVVGDSPIVEAPLYALATASLVDDGKDGPHGPTVCRLGSTRAVIEQLGLPALLLNSVNKDQFALRPAAASRKALDKPLLTGPARSDCGAADDHRLALVERDLEAIFDAVDLAYGNGTATIKDLAVADRRLAALAPATAAGGRLRAVIRMAIAMRRYDFTALGGKPAATPGTLADMHDTFAELENIRSILGDDPGAYFAPSELASLLFLTASTTYLSQPAKTSLLANTRTFRDAIRRIDAIAPIQEAMRVQAFIARFNKADADTALRLITFRLEVEIGMDEILGDCAEASRVLNEARDTVGLPPKPMDDAECRAAGRESGRKFAEEPGWIFDLP